MIFGLYEIPNQDILPDSGVIIRPSKNADMITMPKPIILDKAAESVVFRRDASGAPH
jgi:hypothetical protein